MAFTINIYYTGSNGSAKQFAEEMINSGIVNEFRNKKGNLRYEYFNPLNDDETILLIDSWENQEALDEHHKSETMNKIMKLRNKYDLHMKVERYILEDNNESDKKYIKDQKFGKQLLIYQKDVKIYNNHFVDLNISTQKVNLEDIKLKKEEVKQVKFYFIEEFKEMVKTKDERLTSMPILFEHLLEAIKNYKQNFRYIFRYPEGRMSKEVGGK